ncbi:MAG TPA: AAA family ATPase [bacterium]|jgi:chromosome partitioning protein|nr:AAA family ATPase [bacterium]
MKVITVANQKGGCGKTTIATNLACYFAVKGKKTILVDADTQGSAMNFRGDRPDSRPQFQAVQNTAATIYKDIAAFEHHDYVIIDAGGRDSKAFRSAMFAADLVVFPVKPSQTDIYSTEQALAIYNELKSTKDIKGSILLNMVIPNPKIKLTGEVDEAIKEIAADYDLKIFKTRIFNRLAYQEALAEGLSVIEYPVNDEKYAKARQEIISFAREVEKCL